MLRDDGLEDLVGDRREDPLVVIEPEVLVDLGQVLDVWAREDPERDRDHLEVCCRGGGVANTTRGGRLEDVAKREVISRPESR